MNKLNENIFHQYNKWKTGYVRKENSIQMRLNDFLSKRKDRHADKYHISEDGKYVDCDETVRIYPSELIDGKFPLPFGKIKGNFSCDDLTLTSLVGAPEEVSGNFYTYQLPNLTSLVGAPEKVGGNFSCHSCPNLTSLEGALKEVGGDFTCIDCKKITSLKGAPKEVGGDFECFKCENLKSLEGAPEKVGGEFNCTDCKSLTSLKHLPKKIGGVLRVDKRLKREIPSDIKIQEILYWDKKRYTKY